MRPEVLRTARYKYHIQFQSSCLMDLSGLKFISTVPQLSGLKVPSGDLFASTGSPGLICDYKVPFWKPRSLHGKIPTLTTFHVRAPDKNFGSAGFVLLKRWGGIDSRVYLDSNTVFS